MRKEIMIFTLKCLIKERREGNREKKLLFFFLFKWYLNKPKGKEPFVRTDLQAAIWSSLNVVLSSPLQYLLKERLHHLEWDGVSCVTLNNKLVHMRKGQKSVCHMDLCLSIHISSFWLPYTLSGIHSCIYNPPPHHHHFPSPFVCFPLCGPAWSQEFQFVCGNRSRPAAFICMKMR